MSQDAEISRLAQSVGISMRQLDHWCNRGYLGVHLHGNGPGTQRSFSPGDRVRLQRIAELARAGVAVRVASNIVIGKDKAAADALARAVQRAREVW